MSGFKEERIQQKMTSKVNGDIINYYYKKFGIYLSTSLLTYQVLGMVYVALPLPIRKISFYRIPSSEFSLMAVVTIK